MSVLPVDLGYVERYTEVSGTENRIEGEGTCQKEKKEEGRKRHLGEDTG